MASFKSMPALRVPPPRAQRGDSDQDPGPAFLSPSHPHAITKGEDLTVEAFL